MIRLLVVATLLAAPVTAAAMQDRWTRDAADRLYTLLSRDGREGGHPVGEPVTGRLYLEGMAEQTVRLEPGEYVVVGTCQVGCDLDVHVFGEEGRRPVARDIGAWPHAFADVRVQQAGNYRVQAAMPECSVEPCRYALGIFRIGS